MKGLAGIDERFLEEMTPAWRKWLKRRFWPLRADHEDIIQNTLVALLNRNAEEPVESPEGLRALGTSILKARAIDFFRARLPRAVELLPLVEAEDRPDPDADVVKDVYYQQLMERATAIIARLPPEELELLSRTPEDGPLSSSERSRLSRLRAEIRKKIRKDR